MAKTENIVLIILLVIVIGGLGFTLFNLFSTPNKNKNINNIINDDSSNPIGKFAIKSSTF